MILIDTGAPVDGYLSDITRSYVFGEPTRRQRDVWNLEKEAQAAGFAAAKPGNRCEDIDMRPASSTAPASAPAMPRPACRTAPAMASASTCTNGPIS